MPQAIDGWLQAKRLEPLERRWHGAVCEVKTDENVGTNNSDTYLLAMSFGDGFGTYVF